MVAAHVDVDPGRPRRRAERAEVNGLFAREDADPTGARMQQRIVHDGAAEHVDRFLEPVQHLQDRRHAFPLDISAHAARLHHAVVVSVAGDELEDVEHVLAVAPRPHPDRVEAQEMAGQPQPQQMRMEALQLGNGRSDIERPLRHVDRAGFLDRLDAGDRVRGRADAADALDQEDGFLEILGFG